MYRNAIVVSVLFAGYIALGGTAAQAAAADAQRNVVTPSTAQSSKQTRQKNSIPVRRAPTQKPPPKFWPPGPTGQDAPPSK
jgi:hypothetical protein